MAPINRRVLMLGGSVAAGLFFFSQFPKTQAAGSKFQTPGVKAIGDRWSSGGGTDAHTPGVATGRGNSDDVLDRQQKPSGVGSKHFKDNHTSQRTDPPNTFDKAFNNEHK